ncbi:MAG: NAD-dependent epimerase/dehydratase family protein, partial [Flavobacteriales bacterium]
MNVFVTGGAGFIGSHLTERLVAEGHQVHIFDNLHRNAIKYSSILDHPSVRFTQGDILDKD